MLISQYTAFCRSSCCPTIDVYSGEEEVVIIKDDYNGTVKLTYEQFEKLHAHYLQVRYGKLRVVIRVIQTLIGILAKKYSA